MTAPFITDKERLDFKLKSVHRNLLAQDEENRFNNRKSVNSMWKHTAEFFDTLREASNERHRSKIDNLGHHSTGTVLF